MGESGEKHSTWTPGPLWILSLNILQKKRKTAVFNISAEVSVHRRNIIRRAAGEESHLLAAAAAAAAVASLAIFTCDILRVQTNQNKTHTHARRGNSNGKIKRRPPASEWEDFL